MPPNHFFLLPIPWGSWWPPTSALGIYADEAARGRVGKCKAEW